MTTKTKAPIVQVVEVSGTINQPAQVDLGMTCDGWAVTVTVRVPEAVSGYDALYRLDDVLARTGVSLLHGSRYKVRRIKGSQ